MQIHPLFTVKKAAEVLGVEKQFLRNQLETGTIRGEKRRVGERDKWFIYHGEVKDLRDTKRLHQLIERAKRISTEDLTDFFDDEDALEERAGIPVETVKSEAVESAHTKEEALGLTESFFVEQVDLIAAENLVLSNVLDSVQLDLEMSEYEDQSNTQVSEPDELTAELAQIQLELQLESEQEAEAELEHFQDAVSGSTSITLDTVLQKLTVEFAYRLAEERSRVCELEHLLEAKEECLRLLPDLERQLQAHQAKLADEQAKFEAEQVLRRDHEQEVVLLKEKIRHLEEEKAKPKSWLQRLFG